MSRLINVLWKFVKNLRGAFTDFKSSNKCWIFFPRRANGLRPILHVCPYSSLGSCCDQTDDALISKHLPGMVVLGNLSISSASTYLLEEAYIHIIYIWPQ